MQKMISFKALFLTAVVFVTLTPLSSYGMLDFSGYIRLRASVTSKAFNSPQATPAKKTIFQQKNDLAFQTEQTFHLSGFSKPSQSFELHFAGFSSPKLASTAITKYFVEAPSSKEAPSNEATTNKSPSSSLTTNKSPSKLYDNFRYFIYGKWFLSKEWNVRAGRLPLESSFHQILASNDYERYPYFFDGVFINYVTPVINVNVWTALAPRAWQGIYEAQQKDKSVGMTIDIYSVSEFLHHAHFHLLYLFDSLDSVFSINKTSSVSSSNSESQSSGSSPNSDSSSPNSNNSSSNSESQSSVSPANSESQKATRFGLGIIGKFTPLQLNYKLVLVSHGEGFRFQSDQNLFHFQLSHDLWNHLNSNLLIAYHRDSKRYNPWLYDRHNNAGLLDLFSWGNLSYFQISYESSLNSSFNFKLSFYKMKSTSPDKNFLNLYGSYLRGGETSWAANRQNGLELGQEIDLEINKHIGKRLEASVLFGVFIPDKSIKDFFQNKDFYGQLQGQLYYRF